MSEKYESIIQGLKVELDKQSQRYDEVQSELVKAQVMKEELSQQLKQEKQVSLLLVLLSDC